MVIGVVLRALEPERTVSEGSSSGVVTVTQTWGLSVVRSAAPVAASRAGDRVAYSFVVTNTGNVAVADVRVVGEMVVFGGVFLKGRCRIEWLAPGAPLTCTAAGPYVVKQGDVDRGRVES